MSLNTELRRKGNNPIFKSLYSLAATYDCVYTLLEGCYMPNLVLRALRIQGPTLQAVSGSGKTDKVNGCDVQDYLPRSICKVL